MASLTRLVESALLEGRRPVYVGVFLEKMDRLRLLKKYPPRLENVYADHVTLYFPDEFDDEIDLRLFPLGRRIPLKVEGYVFDGDVEALVVRPKGVSIEPGRIPHITISTRLGVSPKQSNEVVARGWDIRCGGQVLHGRVAWWDGERPRTDSIVDTP